MIGVDPRPFTLRQLVLMADGKSRATWAHTSSIMSAIVAIGGMTSATPAKFNPYTKLDRQN